MVRDIIQKFGGLSSFSRLSGWPKTTVYGWIKKNKIPLWRIDRLKELAKEKGINFSEESDGKDKGM